MGRTVEALGVIDKRLRLNPYELGNHVYYSMKAHAHYTAGQYDEAFDWAQKASQLRPEAPEQHILSAATLGQIGRINEARQEMTPGEPAVRIWTLVYLAERRRYRSFPRRAPQSGIGTVIR
jgi:predicted Zn-dependent protease